MSLYHVNKSKNSSAGFKCTACGYVWTAADTKHEKCPNCGYNCNPYACQVLPSEPKDSHIPNHEKPKTEGYKCTACGYTWTSETAVQDKCPSCGYKCNPYACQVITPEPTKETGK